MNANGAASKMETESAALTELFYGELRAMNEANAASTEDRVPQVEHEAVAVALGRALERYDLRIRVALPDGVRIHDHRGRTLATKMGRASFKWTANVKVACLTASSSIKPYPRASARNIAKRTSLEY